MSGEFRTTLVEGDFYLKDACLMVPYQGQVVNVDELLAPMVGEEIQLAIHHVPPSNPDPTKWGGGCCHYQTVGKCPAGHHEDPFRLLNVHGQGVLRHDPFDSRCSWWLDKFDGSRQDFHIYLLAGHHSRLAAATVFDVEKMREALGVAGSAQIEDLGVRATNLKEILDQLQKHIKET